ncbi:MAG: SdrD B-like domain-containing protein, partial [Chitinophagales bacterium]
LDLDGDGEQDVSETGLEGVAVTLFDEDGNIVATTTTDATGFYEFTDLTPDTYSVEVSFTGPNGEEATTPVSLTTTLVSGDYDDAMDFGYTTEPILGTIGDFAWLDENANGIQDVGETGIAGVTVALYEVGSTSAYEVVTTGINGEYLFTDLPAGDYFIEFGDVEGLTLTSSDSGTNDNIDSDIDSSNGQSPILSLSAGEVNLSVDGGYYATSGLGDYVWLDLDGDGEQDVSETGLEGVAVTLFDEDGNIVATTTTDATGFYEFTDLTPDTYSVEVSFTGPNGEEATTPVSLTTTLVSGDYDDAMDFGYYFPTSSGTIGDFVWQDLNADGIQDAGETGISGVTVTLYDADTNEMLEETVTTSLGEYLFIDLPQGNYYLVFDTPNDYDVSPSQAGNNEATNSDINPTSGQTNVITLGEDETNLNIDAGFYQTTTINTTVWFDEDGDGIQDADETPLSGVTVTLLDENGDIVAEIVTGEDGEINFENLTPGTYTISVPSEDNGLVTTTNAANIITLTSGEQATPTFGYTPIAPELGSIGDLVWNDDNGNGIQDADETGLSGVSVTLFDANTDLPIQTISTGTAGGYLFANLEAGEYYVVFDAPETYMASPNAAGTNPDLDSDANPISGQTPNIVVGEGQNITDIDAGFYATSNVGGTTWADLNGDGIQDENEIGLPNVEISLFDEDGNLIATTITDENGEYEFPMLPSGTYTISTTTEGPNGEPITTDNSVEIEVVGGQDMDDVGFGFLPEESDITGSLWIDTNLDGELSAGEDGLSGILVILYDESGLPIDSTTTDTNGQYNFEDITTGIYTIGVPPFGPNGETIANIPQQTIEVGSGESISDINFGYLEEGGTIIGTAWSDNNTNGTLDGDDTLLGGVVISLFDENGELVTTTLTDANGNYTFNNIPEGNYTVQIPSNLDNPDLILSSENDIALNITVGDIESGVDFVYVESAVLSDVVFLDLNGNGEMEPNEEGVQGIVIILFGADGFPMDTITTDENGFFEFTDLPEGTYTIEIDVESLPDGFEFTTPSSITYDLETGEVISEEDFGIIPTDDNCQTQPIFVGCIEPVTPTIICPDFCIGDGFEIVDVNTMFSCTIDILDDCVQYTALPLFEGADTLEIIACNGAVCDTAYAYVQVSENCLPNNAPQANNDNISVTENQPTIVDVLGNDIDLDGDDMTIMSFTNPLNGTVELVNGVFQYTPDAGFTGTDEFMYQICDENGDCDMASVSIEVVGDCEEITFICAEPISPVIICPEFCELSGDLDVEITEANTTYNCSIKVLENGCVQYTALPLFVGEESITITGCNSLGMCQTIVVEVNVTDDCDAEGANEAGNGEGKIETTETGEIAYNMNIMPSMATSTTTVSFNTDATTAEMMVYDINGRTMFAETLNTNDNDTHNEVLNIGAYPAGIYNVTIRINDNIITEKFVKY